MAQLRGKEGAGPSRVLNLFLAGVMILTSGNYQSRNM